MSVAFIWRDMRLLALDVSPTLAECSGLGEPDDGGVRVELLSSVAKDIYAKSARGSVPHTMKTYPVDTSLTRPLKDITPKHFRLCSNLHTIPYLLNAHLLEHRLVYLNQILSIYVVPPKCIHILSTVDTP